MCTKFCFWQALNDARYEKDPAEVERERLRAVVHLEFVCELYREQMAAGRYFLHELPTSASSWDEACIRQIVDMPGVDFVTADQCQLGAEVTYGHLKGEPFKKAKGFMSNAPELLERLRKPCVGTSNATEWLVIRAMHAENIACVYRIRRRTAPRVTRSASKQLEACDGKY